VLLGLVGVVCTGAAPSKHFECTAFVGGYRRESLFRVGIFPQACVLWLLLVGHRLMLWLRLHHILSPGVTQGILLCLLGMTDPKLPPPRLGFGSAAGSYFPGGWRPACSEQHSRGIYKMCTENKYKKGEVIKNNKSGELRNASAALLTPSSQPGE